MYGAAHGEAYNLDPGYLGAGLPSENRHVIEEILIHTSGDDGISNAATKEAIYMQVTDFFISASQEKLVSSVRFQMLDIKRKTPMQYWLPGGLEWPVTQKKIAVKIFSLATSSAAPERNISTFGFTHSKLRNSLSSQSVERLVLLKTNLNAFYEDPVGSEMDANNSDHSD
jgi:hAT family C-terminal dimerisation region